MAKDVKEIKSFHRDDLTCVGNYFYAKGKNRRMQVSTWTDREGEFTIRVELKSLLADGSRNIVYEEFYLSPYGFQMLSSIMFAASCNMKFIDGFEDSLTQYAKDLMSRETIQTTNCKPNEEE